MTDPLYVPAGEREVVRVFALDLPPAEAEALADAPPANGGPSRLAELTGADHIDREHVEIFPASDLTGIGLSGYLTEGLGVDAAELDGDRDSLEAEKGYIVILPSRAFGGAETRLTPKLPLRLLGAYRLVQPEMPGPMPRTTEDAAVNGPVTAAQTPPPRLPRTLMLLFLLIAAVVALALAYFIGGR